jgi:hypothetical protein
VFGDRFVGASRSAGVFVVDGAEHAVGGMPPLAVVVVNPRCGHVPGLFTGLEVVVSDQHPFSVELNVSATVLSRADRVRPIDCVTLAQWHGSTNRLPACSPALVGVEEHAGHGRRRAPRWPHTALRGPSWAS